MIANLSWRGLALPLVLVPLVAGIHCSSASTTLLCPTSSGDIRANEACETEALVCPYANAGFDQSRTGTTGDCYSTDFIEYACTQKKWVVTAQAASACTLDANGTLSSSDCSPGIGRCVAAAGTYACGSSCYGGTVTAYSAACVAGQWVVTPSSCNASPRDAGTEDDAATIEDASADDAASTDAGDE